MPTAIRSCRLSPQSIRFSHRHRHRHWYWYCLFLLSLHLSPNPWPEIGNFHTALQLPCSLTRLACLCDSLCVCSSACSGGGEMASEAKDVGILAMDIYFPPNCVLQVRVPAPPLFPRAPDSHSPSPLPLDSPPSGSPDRPFDSKARWAGCVDTTTTRFAWFPCDCAFTVAAGFSLPLRLLVPVRVSGQPPFFAPGLHLQLQRLAGGRGRTSTPPVLRSSPIGHLGPSFGDTGLAVPVDWHTEQSWWGSLQCYRDNCFDRSTSSVYNN